MVTAFSADPTQRRIMLALPFVFAIFIINFEAGLIVYWITTNVWTIGQQLLVKKLYPKPVPRELSEDERRRQGPGARQAAAGDAVGAAGTSRQPKAGAGRRSPAPGNGASQQAAAQPAQEEEALGAPALRRRTDAVESRSRRTWWPRPRARAWARPSGPPMKELEPRFPGVTAECVSFEVLDEAEHGEPVRVRAEVDPEAWRAAAEEIPDEPAERVRAIVSRTVHALGLRATVDVEETDDEIRATVNGDDLGLLIGKHGATIDALQHIAYRAAFRGDGGAQAGDGRRGGLPRAPRRRRCTAWPTGPRPTRAL